MVNRKGPMQVTLNSIMQRFLDRSLLFRKSIENIESYERLKKIGLKGIFDPLNEKYSYER